MTKSRMQLTGRVHQCGYHADDVTESGKKVCEGAYSIRRSIYGAETRACQKAWDRVNLAGWPDVLWVEA